MDFPDEFDPRAIGGFIATLEPIEQPPSEGIPIHLESPILNASPLANKEPEIGTLLFFYFKKGCDVHQVPHEIGGSINVHIIREALSRCRAFLREEASRNASVAKMLGGCADVSGVILTTPREGVHNGQLHVFVPCVLPLDTALSLLRTMMDSLMTSDPISISLLDAVEYYALFSGGGYQFL